MFDIITSNADEYIEEYYPDKIKDWAISCYDSLNKKFKIIFFNSKIEAMNFVQEYIFNNENVFNSIYMKDGILYENSDMTKKLDTVEHALKFCVENFIQIDSRLSFTITERTYAKNNFTTTVLLKDLKPYKKDSFMIN